MVTVTQRANIKVAEVNAADELPNEITIAVNTESVGIGVEYQWLPPSCQNCLVFGHTCQPKDDPKPLPPGEDDWIIAGKGKLESSTSLTSVSHPHHPLNSSKNPSNTSQNTPKPSAIISQTVSVTPIRATSTSINKSAAPTVKKMYQTPPLVVPNTSAPPTPVPTGSYVHIVAPSLHTIRPSKVSSESKPNMTSSMLHKLHSNSFHVLEEATPPDKENQEEDAQILDYAIPPDKDPPSEGNNDTKFEDEADYESPSSPVINPTKFFQSDLPTSERSKKQLKKAKKIAKQRSSSKSNH